MTREEYHRIGQLAVSGGQVDSETEIFGGKSITYLYDGYYVYGTENKYDCIKSKQTGIIHTEDSFIWGVPGYPVHEVPCLRRPEAVQIDLTLLSDNEIEMMLERLTKEKTIRKAGKVQELNQRLDALIQEALGLSRGMQIQKKGCQGFTPVNISLDKGVCFVEPGSDMKGG